MSKKVEKEQAKEQKRLVESMTKEEIKDMLNSLKDGSAVKKLQAEVTELKGLVDDQKKQIRELKKTIKELKED